jgi:hypothetical protein
MKLKKSKMKGVAIRELQEIRVLQANATDEEQEEAETIGVLTGGRGRPTGSTALKTLNDRKRKAFDDATNIYTRFTTRSRLPHGGLDRIIERAKLQNGLEDEDWTISANSVSSRLL